MEFRNYTPFPALAFEALDQQSRRHYVVVMRQTLAIEANQTLKYCDDQPPLVLADEYFGEVNASSVRQESDLAPYKPKCDVIVVADAHAPLGRPARRFQVRVRILAKRPLDELQVQVRSEQIVLDKSLTITGPRWWVRRSFLSGWTLTEPEPISSLPIRYEYAYGGELRLEDLKGRREAVRRGMDPEQVPPLRHTVVETNPIGRGYVEDWYLEGLNLSQLPAPQIEDPHDPVLARDAQHAAQGYGLIGRAWLPRRTLCGAADEIFAKSDRWLPADFDFAYWNGAHPDLQVPYLTGDETIELTNLTMEGHLRIELPGHRPFILVRFEEGEIAPAPLQLDTLLIDALDNKVSLTYRFRMSAKPAVRVLEARMITRDEWDAAMAAIRKHGGATQSPAAQSLTPKHRGGATHGFQ